MSQESSEGEDSAEESPILDNKDELDSPEEESKHLSKQASLEKFDDVDSDEEFDEGAELVNL